MGDLKNVLCHWLSSESDSPPISREEIVTAVLEALTYAATFIGIGAAFWHFLRS